MCNENDIRRQIAWCHCPFNLRQLCWKINDDGNSCSRYGYMYIDTEMICLMEKEQFVVIIRIWDSDNKNYNSVYNKRFLIEL